MSGIYTKIVDTKIMGYTMRMGWRLHDAIIRVNRYDAVQCVDLFSALQY